jgi:hypothetical protein
MGKSESYLHSGSPGVQNMASVIQALCANYTIHDPLTITRFLEDHFHLTSLLSEARPQIARHFPDAPVTLKLEADPEGGTQAEQLMVLIGTINSPEVALANLKGFDEGWWLDKVAQARGKMAINVEFR